MLGHFARVVSEACPQWFLLENVPGVPDITVQGYTVQRLNLNASECGCRQNRLRCFQFGYRYGNPLVIVRGPKCLDASPCALATEGQKQARRSWADFCQLQGLPADFDLPGMSRAAKYRAVGNGVPVQMARVIAGAIQRREVTPPTQVCICNCGRPVRPGQTMATAGCRKRMERRRRATAPVATPGTVTAGPSQLELCQTRL
jgi:DNA (cytosine-5)-methyltransferase 1